MEKILSKVLENISMKEVDYCYMVGSYTTGTQTKYSDIDLKIALKDGYPSRFVNEYVDSTYVSIKYDDKNEQQQYENDPVTYIQAFSSFETMKFIAGNKENYNIFRENVLKIDYNTHFMEKIKDYVNKETIDWIEEVNKSLNGLLIGSNDKMLAGLHGLTYGMITVLLVAKGYYIEKSGLLSTLLERVGMESPLYYHAKRAFGIDSVNIRKRVIHGLKLYVVIINEIKGFFTPHTMKNVNIAINNINDYFVENKE